MGLKIGICGIGRHARQYVPLYKAHPFVDEVVLADLLVDRLAEQAALLGVKRTYASLDELLHSDVDAVAIYTQRHLHGPQTIQALQAGKHVYCAVPIAQTLDDIAAIVQTVEETGLIYMTGETHYYNPATLYCRQRYRNGNFGDFVYAEAHYLHDMAEGFYEAYQHSGGDEWKRVAGFPPMYYPTHSMSMILSVIGSKITHVSCLGRIDRHGDGIFRIGGNLWDNVFSNESALMRTANGGMCRVNEFRRVGWASKLSDAQVRIYGTQGSYEEHALGRVWVTLSERQDVTDKLACKGVAANGKDDRSTVGRAGEDFYLGASSVHPIQRLPHSFAGLPNGHSGSHQFLVDDFVKAVAWHQLPPNHVWAAACYCAPGLVAHSSALREGEMMAVPDFGAPPSGWEPLDELTRAER